jgi:recombination protein RecT
MPPTQKPVEVIETPQQIARRESTPFWQSMEVGKGAIAAVLPAHLKVERVMRLVWTESMGKPKLRDCNVQSIILGIVAASQLGLEIGGALQHAWLIAYGTTATLMIGYKGLLALALRHPDVSKAVANVVYREEFDRGLFSADLAEGTVAHPYDPDVDRHGKIAAAYCQVTLKDGAKLLAILSFDEIEDRRKRGASGKNKETPWDTDYGRMARKSAIRALLNGGTVPMSAELHAAIEYEDRDIEPTVATVVPAAAPKVIATTAGSPFDELDQVLGADPEKDAELVRLRAEVEQLRTRPATPPPETRPAPTRTPDEVRAQAAADDASAKKPPTKRAKTPETVDVAALTKAAQEGERVHGVAARDRARSAARRRGLTSPAPSSRI